jgi:hypothetical protein
VRHAEQIVERRCGEEFRHVFRLSICYEQNIRVDSDPRELLRTLLFPFSFVNDSDVGSLAFCR